MASDDEGLSSQVNEAVRAEVERRRQQRALEMLLAQRALDALAGSDGPAKRRVRQAMVAASRLRRDVVIPTVVLAESYRGGGRNQLVDAHVVAVAVEGGGGVVLTGDARDMARLSDPYRTVVIEALPSR